jgi:DNA-binding transcriptional LysR family regulator
VSQFSLDLVQDLLARQFYLTIANEPTNPLVDPNKNWRIALLYRKAKSDRLAWEPSISLDQMNGLRWIIFERRLHPPLYDSIFQVATRRNITPLSVQHVTMPEEAFPFVADGAAVAIMVKAGALRIARNGVTVRPLAEPELRMNTYLVSRADDDSKVASELVRAFMRKSADMKQTMQLRLPISA